MVTTSTISSRARGTRAGRFPQLITTELNRVPLRRAATLLALGEIVFLVSGYFHPDHAHANDHAAAFAEYAASDRWTVVHIGQFVGMAIVITGIVALLGAASDRDQASLRPVRFTTVAAVVSIALYGVLQAVDGVALKQAVDAWVHAPSNEQAAAFRTAEAVRWLEWGVRAFQQFTFGACLVLLAWRIWSTLPRAIAVLAGFAGLSTIIQGYALSQEGFSMRGGLAGLFTLTFNLAWITALSIVACVGQGERRPTPAPRA